MATGSRKVVVLITSICSTTEQEKSQRAMESLLSAKKVPFTTLDGAVEENRDLRNKLFAISAHRAKYPQVFIVDGDEYSFVGLWADIQALNENSDIPAEIMKQNPSITTFDKVFAGLIGQ